MNNRYTIVNLAKEFRENKPLIEAYFKNQSVEGLTSEDKSILGMGIATFLIFFFIALGIWIWAIFALIKYWSVLPDCAKIFGLLALNPFLPIGGPIATLVVVYITKPKDESKFRHY